MAGFRYKYGDRPLDGYTIQHGAGRGGFGEVYYALSDSGREVALKVINGFEQIELRGVSQCMNLKSPHLVTIFDVRHNLEGAPFVIMEYVSGPSLRQIIDEAPGGIGPQKAAFFLREMGKGLAFLHDCGIVHRDLKPGNIFYENGYVMIGDYGLSKAISTTQHSQTITVGTVQYMAPEIGQGRYDKTIDIYALGAVLYEMLTGQVPYLGASPGEILMKHMTGQPDLSNIEEPFATVIRKAMARNPADRYQSVQEMVEAVFGAEHVRQSVSCFSPESLSMVAARAAAHVGGGSSGPRPARVTPPPLPQRNSDLFDALGNIADRTGEFIDRTTDHLERISDRMMDAGARLLPGTAGQAAPAVPSPDAPDPIPVRQRRMLGIATAVIAGVGAGMFTENRIQGFSVMQAMLFGATMTLGAMAGIVMAHKRMSRMLATEAAFLNRLAFGGISALYLLLLSIGVFMATNGRASDYMVSTWAAVILPLFVLNISRWAERSRAQRIALGPAILAGLIGLVCGALFNGFPALAAGALAGACLAVQAAMPWTPGAAPVRPDPQPKRREPAAAPPPPASSEAVTIAGDAPTLPPGTHVQTYTLALPEVPAAVRWGWLLSVPLLVTGGIMLLAGIGMNVFRYPEEQAMAGGFGIGMLLLAIFAVGRFFQTHYTGWWPYIVRPIAVYACVQAVLISAFMMGLARMHSEETMIALFFLLFPILMLPFLLLIRTRPPTSAQMSPVQQPSAAAQSVAPSMTSMTSLHANADGPDLVGWSLAFLAFLLLAAGLLLALLAAVDLPGFIAAGLLDPGLARELSQEFGFERWPALLRSWAYIAAHVVLLISAVLLIIARRQGGAAHMLRVVISITVLALSVAMLDAALQGQWVAVRDIVDRPNVAASIESYLDRSKPSAAVMSLLTFAVGFVLLAWPARKPPVPAAHLMMEVAR